MGISGTPTIVLDDGSMLPGYVPARQLTLMLEGGAKLP
jgi:protein-disulfide isomerase